MKRIFDWVLFVIWCCSILAIIVMLIYNWGYKKGQIDAISGKVKYKLVKKEQTEWIEFKPVKILYKGECDEY